MLVGRGACESGVALRSKAVVVLVMLLCLLGSAQAQTNSTAIKSLLPGGADKWEFVWGDEFDGPDSELEVAWKSQNSGSSHILSSRWRENAVVTNGLLRLVNRKEKRGGNDWTSGNIWTRQMYQYGYFECRYRYGAAEGLNNSFWLMPTGTNKITKGKFFEIDINEGHYPNKVANNIHNHTDTKVVKGRKTHPSASRQFTFAEYDFARDFQVHGLDWNEQELVFYLNGKEIRREKNEFCFSPASVWLSEVIIPWAGRITDAIDGTAMEVDYVRIYRKKP
jgi:beta-glucanase (GH16 family)